MSEDQIINPAILENAKNLVAAIEAGDNDSAEQCLGQLTQLHESELFNELGKLTREFHEALNKFRYDERFTKIAESEIPDAKERLNYVISRTEDAAHRTLNAVEAVLPMCDEISEKTSKIHEAWKRFKRKEMSPEEFRSLAKSIDVYMVATNESVDTMRAQLTEVLMAQDFQDITGQIIRRVITLVDEVEMNLVNLIKLGYRGEVAKNQDKGSAQTESAPGELEGPQVPGMESDDVVSGQNEVDDLLSSLGF